MAASRNRSVLQDQLGVDVRSLCDQLGIIVVTTDAQVLRRELRPVVWMVLESVAMDAVVEDGRRVAHTSARRLAEQLGIDPSTAAGALRALRDRDLLTMERESGPAGRFGLAVYMVNDVDGLSVIPRGECSDVAEPDLAEPHTVDPNMGEPNLAGPLVAVPHMAHSDTATSTSTRPPRTGTARKRAVSKRDGDRRLPSRPGSGQGRLGL